MKNKKEIKLFSKISFIHMIFTFLFLYLFAWFTIDEIEEYINHQIEHRFEWLENKMERIVGEREFYKHLHPFDSIKDISANDANDFVESYKDTLIYNEKYGEFRSYRQKITVLENDGRFYLAKLHRGNNDFIRIKDQFYEVLYAFSLILALFFILFNSISSGYFLRPFYKILDRIKNYSVGSKKVDEEVMTNTKEFKLLQNLFSQMVAQIEFDYKNLKEYTENMAHEIQTPLSIIRNKIENLMEDDYIAENHSGSVKSIYSETNHLSNLGSTLNLLTKIENEEFLKKDILFTKSVIEDHISSVEELIELKKLKIESDLSDKHSIEIDPFLFDIIMKNLIKNAVRYGTDVGSIKIKSTENELEVSNHGSPLEFPEEQLFERFFKKESSDSSLGLGLSIVKTICELNSLDITHNFQNGIHKFIICKK